ncbi:MAG: hypothetical protein HND53_00075 [Proteobacteria bacterium]|nr:hypothetical protein [Pseudomonadota bacterium]NOG58870.1 hypothetical protein [Pseudomonadota bacterium]
MKESSQTILKITLLCIICVMGYALWYQINKPVSLPVNSVTNKKLIVTNEPSISELQLESPVISDYNEMIERPLFFEDRKPYVFVEPEIKAPPTKMKATAPKKNEQYSLSAVMIKSDKKLAIIQSGRDKKLQRLSLGESIDDWVLETIEPRSVLLKKGNETKSLELEIKTTSQKNIKSTKTGSKKTNPKELTEKIIVPETKTIKSKS